MNILRRLPLYRLLLLCGVVVVVGVGVTALASALSSGPTPPSKPLAQAVHDALTAPAVEGVSANVKLTNHLLEGASLASGSAQGGSIASNPLLTGATGRLWIAKDGRAHLELQAEKGDTQVFYDGHTVTVYDAASNTVYKYTPPPSSSSKPESSTTPDSHEVPSVAKIEEAISHLSKHADVTSLPSDVAGQPAYTVHVTPKESGSLLGGAELSFDASNGAPLRAAVYSTSSSSPVIELAATEVSFGPISSSVFQFTPPSGAKVEEISTPTSADHAKGTSSSGAEKPKLTSQGHGLSTVGILEAKSSGKNTSSQLEGLPKVSINGASASELRTELGTVLTFERSGVRYLLAGSVAPASIEAIARGL